jgi:stage II sporulation protein P
LTAFLSRPDLLSFLIYLQTGRVVSPQVSVPTTAPPVTTVPPAPTVPTHPTEPDTAPVFSVQDLDLVEVNYTVDYRPDLETLLTSPLEWSLRQEKPTILIVHTHTTESYAGAPEEIYSENGAYRSLDPRYNMIAVGEEIARVLEAGGIRVIHDKTIHDYPSYNDSYGNARKTIQKHLAEHPEICMVLDVHRDASDGVGGQLTTAGTVGGQKSTQLMLVAGTDTAGNFFPGWQQNLALALKLTAQLEQTDPGLTRPVTLREHRFNMDLTPGSLIVEVGAAGDRLEEALLAANAFARAVLALAEGANKG